MSGFLAAARGRPVNMSMAVVDRLLRKPFRIAGEEHVDITALLVTVTSESGAIGTGECNPFAVPGWDLRRCMTELEAVEPFLRAGVSRTELFELMTAGPARNALDSALASLDLRDAAPGDVRQAPTDVASAKTVSLPAPGNDFELDEVATLEVVKLKIDGTTPTSVLGDLRSASSEVRVLVDANGSLDAAGVDRWLPALREYRVEVFEQPMDPSADRYLAEVKDPGGVVFCADESFQRIGDLSALSDRYDMVNIKLDKVGGPSAADRAFALASGFGLKRMIGCMIGSSLAVAPAWWLAVGADFVDIDGPTLIVEDVEHAIQWDGSRVARPSPLLWGSAV